jgi:Zn-dependent protease with chaperone function
VLFASVALAIFAVLLAWPVPILLSRASWPSRAPATALVLWQAVALAGGLAMIGSLLTFGLIPFGDTLWTSARALLGSFTNAQLSRGIDLVYVLALCAAALLTVHLLANLGLTFVLTERQRRRHRRLVDLLSSPSPDRPNTRVLDSTAPVAYCLPGTLHSVTILSAGLMSLLDENELRAVIEHEKAHLSQRHYVVLMVFSAWRASLPWFPIASRAQREVGMLVELLADDQARRVVDDRTLATAIALVAGVGGVPSDQLEPLASTRGRKSPDREGARVARLLSGAPGLDLGARLGVTLAAIALVAVPTALLIAPMVT